MKSKPKSFPRIHAFKLIISESSPSREMSSQVVHHETKSKSGSQRLRKEALVVITIIDFVLQIL